MKIMDLLSQKLGIKNVSQIKKWMRGKAKVEAIVLINQLANTTATGRSRRTGRNSKVR